jgi:Intracellular proteinase inhibitor
MRYALAVLGVLIGVGISGCGDDDPAQFTFSCDQTREIGEALVPSLTFEDGGPDFPAAEPIRFSMSVTNCADSRIVMRYPNTQRYEFGVSLASDYPRELWKWSNGKVFAESLGEETFEPGETKTYAETWDQRSKSGEQVSPGLYILTGDDLHCEVIDAPPDCASGIAVTFEIKE